MPPQQPSAHGRILGAAFARIADEMEPKCPTVPDRCKTCAFRHGTIPSGMAGTLVQALHCVIGTDPAPFCCHQSLKDGRPTMLCAGYMLAKMAPFERVKDEICVALSELDARREPQSATD